MSERLLPPEELDAVVADASDALRRWAGARVLVTGATGFFGRWMVESLAHADRVLGLGVRCVAMGGPHDRSGQAPALGPAVRWCRGDIRALDRVLDVAGEGDAPFDAIVHLAIEVDAATYGAHPLVTFQTAVDGTQAVLAWARRQAGCRVLLASSGAVYGAQPADVAALAEDAPGRLDPLDPGVAYGEGKRGAEMLAACHWREDGVETVIARPFAFVGPLLPIDRHFAIGNFIRDALAGGPVVVRGDGSPLRSYLYASDLATWLWVLLAAGRPGRAYNVGAEQGRTLAEVAHLVAALAGPDIAVEVRGADAGGPRSRYLPDTTRIRGELPVRERVPLRDGIARTLRWHREGR